MDMSFAYRRRSLIEESKVGLAIALSPNLRRDKVSFSGQLKAPVRFREAISSLHDIVISDLRYQPRDHSAYEAYKSEVLAQETVARSAASQKLRSEVKAKLDIPDGLEEQYRQKRKTYWSARQKYSNHLLQHDRELWRLLMPCDPVITVAEDSVFFECFSADESSYGCLTISRDAFSKEERVNPGTTNVDYTWSLYEHFQRLRSYRETRFEIDPTGFEVQTSGGSSHLEEKIDLPNSWLRGFMQMQSAMSLPLRKVSVSREGIYNVLAFLRRHRAAKSPRAVRFELEPGKPAHLVLEPWEKRIELHSHPYQGTCAETIRVWGRDRLRVLARQLPLIESVDVYLLGTGLPSFWATRMGEMRLTLGLSGWTTNDWTATSALTQIMPPVKLEESQLASIAQAFLINPAMRFDQIVSACGLSQPVVAAGLNRLAFLGQLIHDLTTDCYRWRQVMPVPLSVQQLGSEDDETSAARDLVYLKAVRIERVETNSSGLRVITGQVNKSPVEVLLDGDGRIVRGKCGCSHHFKNALRKGPCRHLQALRNQHLDVKSADSVESWFQSFWSRLR